jgi:hypothetical protein
LFSQDEERLAYEDWIAAFSRWRENPGTSLDDPLGLLDGLQALHNMSDAMNGTVTVEVDQPRNVMARDSPDGRRIVILDPWI